MNVKLIMLGDAGVGKTSLVRRWSNQYNNGTVSHTVGVDVSGHIIHTAKGLIKFRFFDISGTCHCPSLLKSYLFNADACCVVFDLTNDPSFLSAIKLLDTVNKPTLLIGNKVDEESKRIVYGNDVRSVLSKHENVLYIETSAKTNENVKQAMILMLHHFVKRVKKTVHTYKDINNGKDCTIV